MACLYSWISVFTYIQLTMLAGNFKISLWVTCIRQETKKLTDQVFKEKVTLVGTISRSATMAKSVKRSLYILIKIVQFIINELLDKFFFLLLVQQFFINIYATKPHDHTTIYASLFTSNKLSLRPNHPFRNTV